MIKLLAVDMDGTCLNRRSLMTEETTKALELAVKSGITVVPTTGRCLYCLPHQLMGRRDIYRYVISSNGARVTDCDLDTSLFCSSISWETAISLLQLCPGKGVGITSHMDHHYLIQGRMLAFMGRMLYGKDAKGVLPLKNMEEYIRVGKKQVEEIQFYFLEPGTKDRIKNILQHFPELSFASTKLYMEIFSCNTSKGTALTALTEYLGMQKNEVACIGDGENDLAMFEAAGLKFAMGNGTEKLKEKADHVLPSNEKNGVETAIKNYILRGK